MDRTTAPNVKSPRRYRIVDGRSLNNPDGELPVVEFDHGRPAQ